jgi:hypothetical protein
MYCLVLFCYPRHVSATPAESLRNEFFLVIPFYLQSVPVHLWLWGIKRSRTLITKVSMNALRGKAVRVRKEWMKTQSKRGV